MAGNGHLPRFDRMLELAMTSPHFLQPPPIPLHYADCLSDFRHGADNSAIIEEELRATPYRHSTFGTVSSELMM